MTRGRAGAPEGHSPGGDSGTGRASSAEQQLGRVLSPAKQGCKHPVPLQTAPNSSKQLDSTRPLADKKVMSKKTFSAGSAWARGNSGVWLCSPSFPCSGKAKSRVPEQSLTAGTKIIPISLLFARENIPGLVGFSLELLEDSWC